jgi:hypothetical protein
MELTARFGTVNKSKKSETLAEILATSIRFTKGNATPYQWMLKKNSNCLKKGSQQK